MTVEDNVRDQEMGSREERKREIEEASGIWFKMCGAGASGGGEERSPGKEYCCEV